LVEWLFILTVEKVLPFITIRLPPMSLFQVFFGSFPKYTNPPNVKTNPKAAEENIALMVNVVNNFTRDFNDSDCYIVWRLGHVTTIDIPTAQLMSSLPIEADVNFDSNLITGALYVSENLDTLLSTYLKDPTYVLNFQLNNITEVLVPDPTNVTQVSVIFQDSPFYDLLMSGVKIVMWGTDATGTELDPITREYSIAQSLISYYNSIDPAFQKLGITSQTFLNNAISHIDFVDGDTLEQCLPPTHSTTNIIGLVAGIVVGVLVAVVAVIAFVVILRKQNQTVDSLGSETSQPLLYQKLGRVIVVCDIHSN